MDDLLDQIDATAELTDASEIFDYEMDYAREDDSLEGFQTWDR